MLKMEKCDIWRYRFGRFGCVTSVNWPISKKEYFHCMKHKPSPSTKHKAPLIAPLFLGLLIFTFLFSQSTMVTILKAYDDTSWNATIRVTSGDIGNSIIIGETPDASIGPDTHDLPLPPPPPQLPHLTMWLTTTFEPPFHQLLREYKPHNQEMQVWNISVLLLSEPGNDTQRTVILHWDAQDLKNNGYDAMYLSENDTVIVDMRTNESYQFHTTGGTVHRFQLIAHHESSNGSPSGFEVTPLIIIVLVLFISSFIGLIVFLLRKKK